jgi:flagellar biosynthesis/type III secretory pathway M-ring protein FliF/YscJ
MLQLIVRQVGSIVTGIAAIVVVLIVGLFVVRPVSNALLTQKSESAGSELDPMISGALGSSVMPEFAIADYGDMPTGGFDLGREPSAREISQRKIDSIVEADEDRAAAMLKDWIRGGAKA